VQPAILMADVCRSYGSGSARAPVLSGVNLQVRRGECAFLIGPSGSGKSTLLSIIGCILAPDSGTAEVLGVDVGRLDATSRGLLRRDRIGFVFQKFNLIRGLTALENVCVPLTLGGINEHEARKRARHLLREVGLIDKENAHPRKLSSGQCQRVALARALAVDPDLILADEPTASLDAANGDTIMRLLRKLTTEQNKTAVVVTHDQRIFHFADQIFELSGGRLRAAQSQPGAAAERTRELVTLCDSF
jgi:putative ABC transport system ATP-binding protein